jgi:Arc/MetJ family transcription regulator
VEASDGSPIPAFPRTRGKEQPSEPTCSWARLLAQACRNALDDAPAQTAPEQSPLLRQPHQPLIEPARLRLRHARERAKIHIECVTEGKAMRTNIDIDDKLLAKVMKLARARTKREAIHLALEHYVESRDYSRILALAGTGGVAEGYDPKAASPAA